MSLMSSRHITGRCNRVPFAAFRVAQRFSLVFGCASLLSELSRWKMRVVGLHVRKYRA